MDKDRNGTFHRAEGALRQAESKITGVKGEGFTMREPSKAQNAMGGMKDALRDQNARRTG